jgi:hypothetical protein
MARYRHKDETDLRWNRIRRRITTELDARIKDWREEALNKLLSDAWERYAAALQTGEKLELESAYADFARRALSGATGIDLDEVTK